MRPRCLLFLLLFLSALPLDARADLNIFLGDLNNRAAASPLDYNTRLGSQFGIPQPQVSSLMRSVASPADAFMILQLAQMLGLSHDRVLNVYNSNRGKGWGVIAKDLGIKPGSPQFHALKDGRFNFTGVPPRGIGPGPGPDYHGPGQKGQGKKHEQDGPGNWPNFDDSGSGKGKGKGKGHNK